MNPALEALLADCATEPPQPVELPNGRTVYVRSLSAAEGLMLHGEIVRPGDGKPPGVAAAENAARFLMAYLCDEAGKSLVESIEDARQLVGRMRMRIVDRIVDAGRKLNAMDEAAPKTLEKN